MSLEERLEALPAAVVEARRRLEGRLRRTPILRTRVHGDLFGWKQDIRLKLESLQHTGSFKYRPALNGVLAARERGAVPGLVTSSSGNFGIAAAQAARDCGLKLTLVMMPSASSYKAGIARMLGAEVVHCDDDYAARQQRVDELVAERGLVPLHPHDSVETVAGDATVGLEIAEDFPEARSVIVPTSGGGLVGGVALGLREAGSTAKVYGAQPAGNRSMIVSLLAGERRSVTRVETEADGLTAAMPGALGFALVSDRVERVAAVSEKDMSRGLWLLARERIFAELGAAAGLAAMQRRDDDLCLMYTPGREPVRLEAPIVVVVTGANIQPASWVRHAEAFGG